MSFSTSGNQPLSQGCGGKTHSNNRRELLVVVWSHLPEWLPYCNKAVRYRIVYGED